MNNASLEFNKQLELDVLLNGLTEVTEGYVYMFNWQELDEIVIPDRVKSIKRAAFGSCRNLTSITIPDSVTSIEGYAFRSCHSLTDITIPDSVRYISEMAFWLTDRHLSLTFKGKTLDEVRCMSGYPWNIPPEKIHVQVS